MANTPTLDAQLDSRQVERLLQDIRYGARSLAKNPLFSIPAIAVLAIAIAANTAAFSVIDGVLLQPLPFPNSERLVNVWESNSKANMSREFVAPGNYTDWRVQNTVFSAIAAWQQTTFNLTSSGDEPERFVGVFCDPDFFATLKIYPTLGRGFAPNESQSGHDAVLILSHAVWQSRFGGDPNIIGSHLRLDGRTRTVIGVMPKNFEYPSKATMWAPLALDDTIKARRDLHQLRVIARLKDGVSLEQARSQMAAVELRLGEQFPALDRDLGTAVNPMLEDTVQQIRPALLMLMAAVVFVLLIACANVANLLLAKTYARGQEFAVRVSLGAGRRAVAQQLLTESIMLSGVASIIGLGLALALIRGFRMLAPAQLPRLDHIGVDWRALLFTVATAVLTGVLFGLAPALHAASTDLNTALKDGGRGSSSRGHLRNTLVVVQVAVTLILLTGAGLLIRSFYELMHVDRGFDPSGIVTMRLLPAQPKYRGNNDLQIALARGILAKVSPLPGVQLAAISTDIPLVDDSTYIMRFADHPNVSPSEAPLAHTAAVTPEYFKTMRIRLLRGRTFTDRDSGSSIPVAVISRGLADRYFPGRDPLGQQVEVVFRTPPEWRQIVGVVDDVRSEGLDQEAPAQVYTPYLQRPAMLRSFAPPLTVLVRTALDPASIALAVKNAVLAVDRSQPVYAVQPMTEVVSQSVAQRRLLLILLVFFAGSALLLAVLGLYAVMSYAVTQRRKEIGIRIALGAQLSRLLLSFQWYGMRLILTGLVIGVAGALSLARLAASVLFHVQPDDPFTICAVVSILIVAGSFACLIPAFRAARVDPSQALRRE